MGEVSQEKTGTSSIFGDAASQASAEEREILKQDAAATELLTSLFKTSCTKCALGTQCLVPPPGSEQSFNFVKGQGSEEPDVLIVFPQATHTNAMLSKWYNILLQEVLQYVPKDKIRVTFALRCVTQNEPKTLTPETKEYITACREYLETEINLYDPKIVILPDPVSVYAALRKSDMYYEKYFGSIVKKTGRYYLCTNYPKSAFIKEVKAHLSKIPYLLSGGIEADKTLKTKILKTHEQVDSVLGFLSQSNLPIVFDIETGTNIDSEVAGFASTDTLLGVGISWAENKAAFIPVDHDESPFKDDILLKNKLKKFFVGDNIKCAHNALYDVYGLAHFLDGIKVKNLVFDTMLAHHVINPTKGTHSLKYLVTQYTKFGGYEEQVKQVLEKLPKEERSYGKLDLETLGLYCNYDCIGTYILWDIFDTELAKNAKLQRIFDEITFPCHDLMLDLKNNPWIVDEKKLAELNIYYNRRYTELHIEIQQYVKSISTKFSNGINLNSPAQLISFITNDMKLVITTKTKEGNASASKESIENLRNDIKKQKTLTDDDRAKLKFLENLLLFRTCEKIKSTYIEGLSKHITDGKIYTEYLIEGTETARLSSRKPNMQNIHGSSLDGDKESSIKSIFVAPQDYEFVVADYSQIELRNLANITGDDTLTMAFLNGINNHQATAGLLFGKEPDEIPKGGPMYRVGKMINFAVVYGASPKKLAIELGKLGLTYEELVQLALSVGYSREYATKLEVICKGVIDTLYRKWKKVNRWQYRVKQEARQWKRTITPFGRVRYLRELTPGGLKVNILNQAINTPIQSVSSDCLLIALVAINREFKRKNFKSYMVGTVHDSGVFYVHKDEKEQALEVIKRCMEKEPTRFNPEFFVVPLKVEFEIGTNWANVEPIDVP